MTGTQWLSTFILLLLLNISNGISRTRVQHERVKWSTGIAPKWLQQNISPAEVENTRNVYAEVNGVKVNSPLINGAYVPRITLFIPFKNVLYSIDLTLNIYFLAPTYFEKIVTEDGDVVRQTNHTKDFCYYIGKVRNEEESDAAFSTCDGIKGFFIINEKTFHVTPLSVDDGSIEGLYEIRKGTKGTKTMRVDVSKIHSSRRVKRDIIPGSLDGKLVIETYVVIDQKMVDFDNNAETTIKNTKETVNFANLLLQQEDIFVILIGVELWQRNPINVAKDPLVTLQNWCRYRLTTLNDQHYSDVGFLFSGEDFDNGTITLTPIGKMCSSSLSCGILAREDKSTLWGYLLAREIGHVLGLKKDEPGCVCPDAPANCIMNNDFPTLSLPRYFSSCSKQQLQQVIPKGFDLCLRNMPKKESPYLSVCGNGFLEDGEECDCGEMPIQECNSNCCNSTTCKLIGSANCSSGVCCDLNTCQPKQPLSACRSVVGSCDLPEFCDGISPFCPKDVFKHNGLECSVDGVQAYCWNGLCRSHRTQCQRIYGFSARESNDFCYIRNNVIGSDYGNCGFKLSSTTTYTKCKPENAMCGTLFCDASDNSLTIANYVIGHTQNWTVNSNQFVCDWALLDFGNQAENPGMVPNGAACAPGKMCVSHECVDASSVPKDNPCPIVTFLWLTFWSARNLVTRRE